MHPTIRVMATQPGDPPPGTIRTDAAGELLVYLSQVVTPEQIAELVPVVRQVRLATLIAPSLETAREVRRSIQHHGKPSKTRTAPAMKLPPVEPLPPRGRCGAPRSDGQPCQQLAGSGTDRREGACAWHGGQPTDHSKRLEELTEQALRWTELNTKARTEELSPAERLASLTAARALLVARRDGVIR